MQHYMIHIPEQRLMFSNHEFISGDSSRAQIITSVCEGEEREVPAEQMATLEGERLQRQYMDV